jgi:hypothetical protein
MPPTFFQDKNLKTSFSQYNSRGSTSSSRTDYEDLHLERLAIVNFD